MARSRKGIEIQLNPFDGIADLEGPEPSYRALQNAPLFILNTNATQLPPAWYFVQGKLERHSGNRESEIRGHKSDTAEFCIPVTATQSGTIGEVIELPNFSGPLYWSPMKSKGIFTQSSLQFRRIGSVESWLRRSYRVFHYRKMLATLPNGPQISILTLLPARLKIAYGETSRVRSNVLARDYGLFLRQRRKPNSVLPDKPICLTLSLVIEVPQGRMGLLGPTLKSIRNSCAQPHQVLVTFPPSENETEIAGAFREHRVDGVIVHSRQNGTSAERLNAALDRILGDCFMVLHAGDQLRCDAVTAFCRAFAKHPSTEMFYCDDDKLSASGHLIEPRFKPDWNPDLFRSSNYIGRAAAWRTGAVRRLGGFGNNSELAEHYDLSLRIAFSQKAQVGHITNVLFTIHPDPGDSKECAIRQAEQRALSDSLTNTGWEVRPGLFGGSFRVTPPLDTKPKVSLIIPTRDQSEILKNCIESVLDKTSYGAFEILVVDNGSIEPRTIAYLSEISRLSQIRVLRHPGPFNYSAINNDASRQATGEILGFLNNDVEVISSEWLEEMVRHVSRQEVGAVGAKLLYPDGMVQHAGVVLGIGGIAGHVHRFLADDDPGYMGRAQLVQNLSAVTGACLLVRKSVFDAVGGFDEKNLAVAYNDIDLCLRIGAQGLRNLYTPYAKLYHHESFSRGRDNTPAKRLRYEAESGFMLRVWATSLQRDPAYNPNLTLEREDFGFAFKAN